MVIRFVEKKKELYWKVFYIYGTDIVTPNFHTTDIYYAISSKQVMNGTTDIIEFELTPLVQIPLHVISNYFQLF